MALPRAIDFNKFIQAQANVNLLHAIMISAVVTIGAELLTLLSWHFQPLMRLPECRLAYRQFGSRFQPGLPDPRSGHPDAGLLDDCQSRLLYHPIALVILYPAFSLPLSLVLLSSFMRKLPRELEESAVMDGGNVLQIIIYIFFPICMPGILTVLVLNFINIWNEYLFALILMDSNNRPYKLATALLRANQRSVDYGLIAAGVLISMIPVFIAFIFFQDKIMSGMLTGAIKE